MKKCAVLLPLFVIILFTACSSMTFSNESPHQDLPVTGEVTISIKEDSVSDTSLILVIKNNTAKELSYDMTYTLERKKDNTWYSLDQDMAFNALAAILKPNAINEFPVSWDAKLSKGVYRIVKPVVTENGICPVAAEFSVGTAK